MSDPELKTPLTVEAPTYPPSWIDSLIAWVDRLPGPVWPYYGLGLLVSVLVVNGVFWIDGSMPAGSFDPLGTSFAFFIVYWPLLYRYLTHIGYRSLRVFRPLLGVGQARIDQIGVELATLPRNLGRLAIPIGFGFAALTILGDPEPYGEIVPRTALPFIGDILVTGFMASTFLCLLIRSIRQLRMVARLHARATNINLLDLGAAHAFSDLTARTGVGVILVLIFGYISDPLSYGSPIDLLVSLTTAVVAIGIFVLPIMGMQDRIEQEKKCTLNKTNSLLQDVSDRLHNRLQTGDYQDIADTDHALQALVRERALIKAISTWPWDPKTIRGFSSALLLPIFLWLVTRLLERVL